MGVVTSRNAPRPVRPPRDLLRDTETSNLQPTPQGSVEFGASMSGHLGTRCQAPGCLGFWVSTERPPVTQRGRLYCREGQSHTAVPWMPQ